MNRYRHALIKVDSKTVTLSVDAAGFPALYACFVLRNN